jgi:hypothetical protein
MNILQNNGDKSEDYIFKPPDTSSSPKTKSPLSFHFEAFPKE